MWPPRKKKSKYAHVKAEPKIDNCSLCERDFDWNVTPGIINGAGKVFCGHDCFKQNIERVLRHDVGYEFDQL